MLPAVGTGNSVMTPAVVIRPTRFPSVSVNHRLPSGPGAIVPGLLRGVGIGNSVRTPAEVIRPIWLPSDSTNQRLPSGPAVIPSGSLPAVGMETIKTSQVVGVN